MVKQPTHKLGNAVNKTVHQLVEMILTATVDDSLREHWLERLWTAFEEDGVDFLWEVNERWANCAGVRSGHRAPRTSCCLGQGELAGALRLLWGARRPASIACGRRGVTTNCWR